MAWGLVGMNGLLLPLSTLPLSTLRIKRKGETFRAQHNHHVGLRVKLPYIHPCTTSHGSCWTPS